MYVCVGVYESVCMYLSVYICNKQRAYVVERVHVHGT